MPKFRKKPIIIIAHKWNQNGDHPEDNCEMVYPNPCSITQFDPFLSEGKVVRYFRRPDISGNAVCSECEQTFHVHGWIDNGKMGQTVCPGDWIITDVNDGYCRVSANVFETNYELIGRH